MNNTTVNDHFFNVLSTNFERAIFATLFFTLIPIGHCLCYFIIDFEQNSNDRGRTLINDLYSLIIKFIWICQSYFINVISGLRAAVGPLPSPICQFYMFNINIFFFELLTCLNEAIFVRYLYGCFFKGVGYLNEELLFHFFTLGKHVSIPKSTYILLKFIQFDGT